MSHENPWKKLSERIVYSNPWITVHEHQVVSPGGKVGIYGIVETRIATGIVALSDDMQVYLVGQYRYPMNEYSWEIPEGGSEKDEDALVAAQRELREETGLVAASWQQLGGEVHLSNCHSSERGVLFLARDLQREKASPDHTELLEVRVEPFSKCLEMVDRGEIRDSLTIIAILRTARLIASGAL